jgi:hypothetical protein
MTMPSSVIADAGRRLRISVATAGRWWSELSNAVGGSAVAEELLDQRLVETSFCGSARSPLVRRRAGAKCCGIAGQRPRQQERDDHDLIRLGIANINRSPIMVSMTSPPPVAYALTIAR